MNEPIENGPGRTPSPRPRRSPRRSFRSGFGAFASQDDGQSTIIVAVSLVVLLLFLGLGLDVGSMRMSKVKLQNAADAAAVAAGLEINQCGDLSNCSSMQNAAKSALQENGYNNITIATNCASPGPVSGMTLTINGPPCALGSADPNSGKKTAVEVVVSGPIPLSFAKILGFNQAPVTVRAEAARPTNPPCVYALDPHAAGAISVVAGVGMTFSCGLVDESDSSSALGCLVGVGITAPSVKVTGGASGLLCSVPNLQVNVARPTPTDPMAYLPKPSVGSCGYSSGNVFYGSSSTANIAVGGTYTFNPGVYCGGISITAAVATNITFNPGTYVLKTGPGPLGASTGGLNITLSLLSNIQGSGVTFYNLGTVGGFTITASTPAGLSNVALSAPTTGTYSGVLFFQDPGNTNAGSFTANLLTGSKFEGAYYLPTATLTYAVSVGSASYNIIVAKDVNFAVAAVTNFSSDYSALSLGSPINRNQALLVQ